MSRAKRLVFASPDCSIPETGARLEADCRSRCRCRRRALNKSQQNSEPVAHLTVPLVGSIGFCLDLSMLCMREQA
ncbi:hypothetical protein BDW68DRAFT_164056 [Aspergillus falconensis]